MDKIYCSCLVFDRWKCYTKLNYRNVFDDILFEQYMRNMEVPPYVKGVMLWESVLM